MPSFQFALDRNWNWPLLAAGASSRARHDVAACVRPLRRGVNDFAAYDGCVVVGASENNKVASGLTSMLTEKAAVVTTDETNTVGLVAPVIAVWTVMDSDLYPRLGNTVSVVFPL
jgi:hypothetical protein